MIFEKSIRKKFWAKRRNVNVTRGIEKYIDVDRSLHESGIEWSKKKLCE